MAEYAKLRTMDSDDVDSDEPAQPASLVRWRPGLPSLPRSRFFWLVSSQLSARTHAQAHEISVELETAVSVRSEDDLLWGAYWCRYGIKQVWAQARIVVPLCLYVVGFKDGVLQGRTDDVSSLVLAVGATCAGLALFLEGLQLGVMPLSEAMGTALPRRAPLPVTLTVAGILGVGVTFAEPAIGALQAVGKDVDCAQSPYLFELLNGWSFYLVSAVGAGVGVAAVIGVLRFLEGWSLKPIVYILLCITLSLTAIVQNFTHQTHGVIALAWDCGAVTTGPVTVPCVIALGVGVVASSPTANADNPLSAFGLVTMASLLPITSVLILTLFLHNYKSPESIIEVCRIADAAAGADEYVPLGLATEKELEMELAWDGTLNVTLLESGMGGSNMLDQVGGAEAAGSWDGSGGGGVVSGGSVLDDFGLSAGWMDATPYAEILGGTRALGPLVLFLCVTLKAGLGEPLPRVRIVAKGTVKDPDAGKSGGPKRRVVTAATNTEGRGGAWSVWPGIFMSYTGIILFNIGLKYGLSRLGNEAGRTLPAAFMDEPTVAASPLFTPERVGIAVVLAFAYVLGFTATMAEPALAALRATVQRLTRGAFSPSVIRWAVPFGVSLGIVSGLIVVMYEVDLSILLYCSYFVTACVTSFASEEFTNIAWDSAGVTTGPITVPLVLSLGSGLGVAMGAKSGFGILTLSSVCPILSVLVSGFLPCCQGKVVAPEDDPEADLMGGHVNVGTQYSPVPDEREDKSLADDKSPPTSPPGSASSGRRDSEP
eukprot:COSAG06_NODE_37_length_30537_cov_73.315658_1_plen_768_part_00